MEEEPKWVELTWIQLAKIRLGRKCEQGEEFTALTLFSFVTYEQAQ
jgi:hypothetical protein